ncbi:MAG: hypothetical protein GX284_14840 [Clostridiales bacterium]|nr:hypothetical protein [Clostridiales bacterium]
MEENKVNNNEMENNTTKSKVSKVIKTMKIIVYGALAIIIACIFVPNIINGRIKNLDDLIEVGTQSDMTEARSITIYPDNSKQQNSNSNNISDSKKSESNNSANNIGSDSNTYTPSNNTISNNETVNDDTSKEELSQDINSDGKVHLGSHVNKDIVDGNELNWTAIRTDRWIDYEKILGKTFDSNDGMWALSFSEASMTGEIIVQCMYDGDMCVDDQAVVMNDMAIEFVAGNSIMDIYYYEDIDGNPIFITYIQDYASGTQMPLLFTR